jgi:CheY-like chemotaxis protein
MGGSIRVDTVAGQGSVFSFSFPLEWARDSMSSLPQVSPAEAAALLPRTSAPPPAPRQQPLDARLDWGPAHGRACRSQGGAASQASAGARSGATDAPPTPGGARPGAPAPRFGGGSDSSLGGSFAYFGASGAASTIALTSNSRRSSGDDSQGSLEPALPSASSSGGGASSGPAPARRPPLPPPPVDFRSSAFYSSGDSAGAASPMSRPSAEEERPSAAAGLARGPPQLMAPPPPRASPLAGRTVVVDVEHEPLALQIVDSCALFGMSARRGACDAGADAGAPAADFCVTTADRAQAALRGGWKGRPLVALGWKDNMPLQIQPTVTVVPLPVKHARLLAALLQAAAFQLCTRNAAAHSDPALLSLLSDRHPLGRVGASRRSVDNSALERSKVVPLSAAALQQRDSLDAPSSAAAAATGSWMPTLATVRSLATSATPRSSLDSQRPARFAAIAEDAAEGEGEGAGAAPAAAAAGEPLERADSWPLLPRILVAEDNPINVRVVLRVLGHVLPGAAVDVVGNGVEVLAAVRRRAYGLVLMDVHMPEMDGLEAARRLTATLPAADRPLIVALSADTMQALPDRCRAAGMADFVSKPFRIEDVRRIVRLMVDRQQATAVAGALERAAAP